MQAHAIPNVTPAPSAAAIPTYARAAAAAEGEDPCVICLGRYEQGAQCKALPCGHHFHAKCIDSWLQQQPRCPTCQTQVVVPAGIAVAAVPGGASVPTQVQQGQQLDVGRCRTCGVEFVRPAGMNRATSQYYNCPEHSGLTWGSVAASCVVS